MAINDPTDIANLFAWFRGDSGVENASDLPAARAEDVKDWDDSEVPISTTQATASQRPFYYDGIVNGMPGVSFRGPLNNQILQSVAAHEQIGDFTAAVYQSEAARYHQSSTGQLFTHGLTSGAEDEVENETYDIRITNGVPVWFHENGVGVNNVVTSTIALPKRPSSVICRRNISTNEITFDLDGQTETLGYTNDATGGTSGRLHLGAFGVEATPVSELTGNLLELAFYTRRLNDTETQDLEDYFAERYEQRRFSIVDTGNFNIGSTNDVQGLWTDGVHVWAIATDFLRKYTIAGTLVDSRDTTGTALDAWGGCYVFNGILYLIRFSQSQPSEVWQIDANDLAGGTLDRIQGLAAAPVNGIGGLERLDDAHWLCGWSESGSDPDRKHRLFRLSPTFDYLGEIDIAAINHFGVQDLTTGPYGEIYVDVGDESASNDTTLYRYRKIGSDFVQDWDIQIPYRQQGVAWDPIGRQLLIGERNVAGDKVHTNSLLASGGLQVECLGALINA